MLNVAVIAGNLTKDPELRTAGETQVCNFTIATNEKNKDGDDIPCFMDLVAWGKNAENIAKWMKKGQEHHFVCRIKQDTWEDKETGKNRSAIKFNVINWSFGRNPKNDEDGTEEASKPAETKKTEEKKQSSLDDPFADD